MFEVERADGSGMPQVDVLSCGNGQWGGLGNAQYSNAQSSPVRVKNVSGLFECKWILNVLLGCIYPQQRINRTQA